MTSVGLVECRDESAVGELTADVELTVATGEPGGDARAVSLVETAVDEAGVLRLTFESGEPVVPTTGHDVAVETEAATVAPDGTVTLTLAASVRTGNDPGRGASGGDDARGGDEADDARGDDAREDADDDAATVADESSDDGEAAKEPSSTVGWRDRDVPPFRDPELLAEVYESCETFAEMTDALGMDVTAETVRRYMIDYGIHEPNSYDTGGGDDAVDGETEPEATEDQGQPAVLADGVGLPDDVTVESFIETVMEATTIYEVRQGLGMGRDDVLDVLRELNLLDLVVGRLATEAERNISRGEVVDRIRNSAAAQ